MPAPPEELAVLPAMMQLVSHGLEAEVQQTPPPVLAVLPVIVQFFSVGLEYAQ